MKLERNETYKEEQLLRLSPNCVLHMVSSAPPPKWTSYKALTNKGIASYFIIPSHRRTGFSSFSITANKIHGGAITLWQVRKPELQYRTDYKIIKI